MPSRESTWTGALFTADPRRPRRARASRSQIRPPIVGLVEAADRGVQGDDRVGRPHVDHVDEGLEPDRVLGGEDRALELGAGNQPPAAAGRDSRHERVGQRLGRGGWRVGVHAVESMAPRWLSMRSSSLGCAEMDMASSYVTTSYWIRSTRLASKRAHALLLARRDDVEQLVGLALPNEVPHRVVGHQDLEGGDHAAADPRHQPLRDHRSQGAGQLDPDLLLPEGREDVDDSVDGLSGIVGVQRREHQVARLGQRQGELDGLEVSHLTDEEDVGVLPESGTQRPLERRAVEADLALVDGGEIVLVHVLDRVLDREDVEGPCRVDPRDD